MTTHVDRIAMSFSAARAAELAGISLPMLNYLCRSKLVVPTPGPSQGHGIKRAYSFGDVVALRLVAKLSAAGVSVLRLRKALVGLRKLHPEITLTSLPASHIVTDGRDLYLRRRGESLERALDGQFAFAFVVELAPLRDEVAAGMLTGERSSPARPRKKAA
jgi:DNA-binding transcriptional MerR regulator